MTYNNNQKTRIIFHGGEPLLLPINFYKRCFSYIRDNDYPIEICLQTNGTLISKDLIELIKEYNVRLGISLDGPEYLHNITRKYKNGSGSFRKIFENITDLKKADINFGCLVTINRSNIDHIKDIYEFFKKEHIPYNIRPIFKSKEDKIEKWLVTPEEYANAFCSIFDIWFEEESEEILVEEFASLIAQFICPIEGLVSCAFSKTCNGHFISLDSKGNIYPCDRLYGEPAFLYGNINTEKLEDIMQSKKVMELSNRCKILQKNECMNCEIFKFCYGGCPGNAYYYYDDYNSIDYYCSAYKRIISHVNAKIKSILPPSDSKND